MSFPKFKEYDLVFAVNPLFFHAEVRGSFIDINGNRVYVVLSVLNGAPSGPIMHVEERYLKLSKGTLIVPGTAGKG